MKFKYRNVDTSTEKGLRTAERLHTNGWKMTQTGLFLIQFCKQLPKRAVKK